MAKFNGGRNEAVDQLRSKHPMLSTLHVNRELFWLSTLRAVGFAGVPKIIRTCCTRALSEPFSRISTGYLALPSALLSRSEELVATRGNMMWVVERVTDQDCAAHSTVDSYAPPPSAARYCAS